MIFDNIKNRRYYTENGLAEVLEAMSNISNDNFPKERIQIVEDDIFINPVTLVSKPEEDCIFEAHKKFADVHYIVSGVEVIQVSDIAILSDITKYNEQNDILFYKTGDISSTVILKAGDFLVCYPHDSHKVAIQLDGACNIKKLVGKIRI